VAAVAVAQRPLEGAEVVTDVVAEVGAEVVAKALE
jgi:hypothetical protein